MTLVTGSKPGGASNVTERVCASGRLAGGKRGASQRGSTVPAHGRVS